MKNYFLLLLLFSTFPCILNAHETCVNEEIESNDFLRAMPYNKVNTASEISTITPLKNVLMHIENEETVQYLKIEDKNSCKFRDLRSASLYYAQKKNRQSWR